MAPAATGKAPVRKRKRKRKQVESSSSESSSSSPSDSEDQQQSATPNVPVALSQPAASPPSSASSSISSSSDSDSDSSSESEKESPIRGRPSEQPIANTDAGPSVPSAQRRRASISPSPPPAPLPSFLPERNGSAEADEKEKKLKERFRQFWMASIADEFKDDLEELRKEPGLTQSRLTMLINGLMSASDVFSSRSEGVQDGINEMELVMEAVDAAQKAKNQ
ncbi:hypothetical protein FRB96_006676 [Tulasnella sp. 330]|nr:hypothetical protein FRB96_006676 [Tulasnella sp. 330]